MKRSRAAAGVTMRMALCAFVMAAVALPGVQLLTGQLTRDQDEVADAPLPQGRVACSKSTSEIKALFPEDDSFEKIRDDYHEKVDKIVEELLTPGTETCIDSGTEQGGRKLKELRELGEKLPGTRAAAGKLTASDAPGVLLEYLRLYECVLNERSWYLPLQVLDNNIEEQKEGGQKSSTPNLGELGEGLTKAVPLVAREQVLARRTLERMLTALHATLMARTVEDDAGCFLRSSFDAKNAFGLAQEASMCLPRTWDAKDVLRDLPTPTEE